ncbi:MAG: hypothetical protein WCO56_21390 [Verrucomicrobiota bacterium]
MPTIYPPRLHPQPPPLLPPKLPVAKGAADISRRPRSTPWGIILVVALTTIASLGYFGFQIYQLHDYPPGYRNRPSSGVMSRPGEHEFSNANEQIDSFQSTNAFGNTPAAVKLAHEFAVTLQAARTKLFTAEPRFEFLETTKGEFITYCELHRDECAFIVHVPALRKYDKDFTEKVDARKLLAQAAWMSAQTVLKANRLGKPKMELAVGLRGISQYGPIMIGYYVEATTQPDEGLIKDLDDGAQTHFLWPFFTPAAEGPAAAK